MTPKTIQILGKLGIEAAEKLRDDFSRPRTAGEANAWERHRWTRARTTLSALRAYLAAFVGRLAAGQPDYTRLLRTATPIDHPFQEDKARQQVLELVEGTRALMHTIEATIPADALDQNTPRPLPGLHMSPPWRRPATTYTDPIQGPSHAQCQTDAAARHHRSDAVRQDQAGADR
jgi:hypothetical protein